MEQPKMFWRRVMAFIGIAGLLWYTLIDGGADPWVIGAYLYLVSMWIFNPDTFINLVGVLKGFKKDDK